MPYKRKILVALAALAGATLANSAVAQDYPTKPIRIIVPFPAASSTDLVVRIVAQKLGERWAVPIIIENKAGAGGNIGSQAAAIAPPDGYTLLATTAANPVSAALYPKLNYDLVKDFAHITQLTAAPLVIVANPAQPFRTLPELIATAKKTPGSLHFGSGGNGTINHLTGEMLNQASGIRLVHVPYKSGSAAVADVLGDQIELAIDSVVASYPSILAGKLRAIAVTSRDRLKTLPDVPTVSESGLPGFEVVSWHGLSAPAGTPKPIIAKLASTIAEILKLPDVQQNFAANGAVPQGTTPQAFTEFVRAEVVKWGAAVKLAQVRID